jgi:hypothetical protein
MSSVTRLFMYLAYNPLYAKESYKKQGMLFGRHRKGPIGVPVGETSTRRSIERPAETTSVR